VSALAVELPAGLQAMTNPITAGNKKRYILKIPSVTMAWQRQRSPRSVRQRDRHIMRCQAAPSHHPNERVPLRIKGDRPVSGVDPLQTRTVTSGP
jgi:hypothetical protein